MRALSRLAAVRAADKSRDIGVKRISLATILRLGFVKMRWVGVGFGG